MRGPRVRTFSLFALPVGPARAIAAGPRAQSGRDVKPWMSGSAAHAPPPLSESPPFAPEQVPPRRTVFPAGGEYEVCCRQVGLTLLHSSARSRPRLTIASAAEPGPSLLSLWRRLDRADRRASGDWFATQAIVPSPDRLRRPDPPVSAALPLGARLPCRPAKEGRGRRCPTYPWQSQSKSGRRPTVLPVHASSGHSGAGGLAARALARPHDRSVERTDGSPQLPTMTARRSPPSLGT